MTWPTPQYSKSEVNRAGNILRQNAPSQSDLAWAMEVLGNWRSSHGYPINTFQATLRSRLQNIDPRALVVQRLKRTPSIIAKLRRFPTMQLARMQDIGGLRAVVSSVKKVRELQQLYSKSKRFKHVLVRTYDYINKPKTSGYRGVHLVYQYKNKRAPAYDGLLIELQIRTRLQHAWATAVETIGIFIDHALKSSEGPKEWLDYFALVGSAFAHMENCPVVSGYDDWEEEEVFQEVARQTEKLNVLSRLDDFRKAVKNITTGYQSGSYHLIVLDPDKKTVSISSYGRRRLEEANEEYSKQEQRIAKGESIQVVLVSAESIEALKRAYPNYFLDMHEFLRQVQKIIKRVKK